MRSCLGFTSSLLLSLAALVFAGAACTSDDGGGGGGGSALATGEGPCEASSQCDGDVCVAIVDGDHPPVYCTESCAGGCPSGFWCDSRTFALVGLEFCRFGDTATEEPPAQPPRRPCRQDNECDSGEVCATYKGERGCTRPCTTEEQCTPPSTGGFTFDFLTCDADQTPSSARDVCLPDPACFLNPTSCVRF